MAGYDKDLGERNFRALNDAIKDLIKHREDDKMTIDKLKTDMMNMKVQMDMINQTLNVYKAMSMGNGSTAG